MTPNTDTQHSFTISHRISRGNRLSPMPHGLAPTRCASPVLSVRELRQLVSQMVD